jgi:hypothetical protein
MKKNVFLIIMALVHLDLLSENRISIATYSHFNSESEPEKWWKSGNQNKKPIILSYDRFYSDSNFYGLALFNNSFGQFSQYIYKGHQYESRFNNIYYELSYGILHGYKDEYQDRIPINTEEGFGIGVIPSIIYSKGKNHYFGLSLMGDAGLIFSYSKKI